MKEKTKQASLAEKTGVVVFSRILTTVLELALAISLVNLLAKTDFAIISYLLLIYESARYLATLGFPESVFYFFERVTRNARKAFALQTCAIMMVTATISAMVIFAISFAVPSLLGHWDEASQAAIMEFLPIMALVSFLEIPTWPVPNVLLAADRQKDAAWYQLLTSALTFGAIIGPLALGYPLMVSLYCLLGYSIIRFIISFIWLWAVLPPLVETSGKVLLKEQIKFAIPIGASSLVSRFNKFIDKFVVSLILPAAALAEYNVGAQEIPIVRVIPFAVGSVLISRYVSLQLDGKKEELLQLWYKGIKKVSLVVLPLTVMFVVIAYDFITVLFGEEYEAAVIPFQIYSLIILMRVTHYGSILQAFGDTKGVLYTSLNLLVANIILSVPFTLMWGINGAAFSTLLANFYNWVVVLRRIGGHMELPAHKVLPFPYYLKVMSSAIAGGILAWLVRYLAFPNIAAIAALGLSMIIFLLLFALIGTLTKTISKEDWIQFGEWMRLKFLYS
ncbi:MAG: oligosaccharide flippase family protein [Balneolales bacterium]